MGIDFSIFITVMSVDGNKIEHIIDSTATKGKVSKASFIKETLTEVNKFASKYINSNGSIWYGLSAVGFIGNIPFIETRNSNAKQLFTLEDVISRLK